MLHRKVAVSDLQMIANWMPFSAAVLIRELCSVDLSRQRAAAAENRCIFRRRLNFEFLNQCGLASIPSQGGVAICTRCVVETQRQALRGRWGVVPAVSAEGHAVSQSAIMVFDGSC